MMREGQIEVVLCLGSLLCKESTVVGWGDQQSEALWTAACTDTMYETLRLPHSMHDPLPLLH